VNYPLSEKRKSCNLHPPRAAVGNLEGILLKLALMGPCPRLCPHEGYLQRFGLKWPASFPEARFLDNFRIADQQARMRRVASRPGSTVALVANESINQHFKSPAESFCRLVDPE